MKPSRTKAANRVVRRSKPLRIALVQQHATTDKQDNLERGVRAARAAAERNAQVIVFAELAFEPFYPQDPAPPDAIELAEPIPGPTIQTFSDLAIELGVILLPNLYERDGDAAYDTTAVIDADGSLLGKSRMLHIPDYAGFHEKGYYTPGNLGAPVFETRYGRIGVAICYDRHYPEVLRTLALAGAQVVFVPQAGAVGEWPEGLFEAELRVASFHNGLFTALCNRVGKEASLTFAGESFVCNPAGEVIARAGGGADEVLVCDLDLAEIDRSQARRLFLPDRRPELYESWAGRA
jgi:predicted amidohydrolase